MSLKIYFGPMLQRLFSNIWVQNLNYRYLFCPEKHGPSPHGGIFDGPRPSRISGDSLR